MAPIAAQALPNWATVTGNSCSVCHATLIADQPAVSGAGIRNGYEESGRMKVTVQALQANLITQLNGKNRGNLETFVVDAGSTVTLSVEVLTGADSYAIQLKRLETEGQANSQDNLMVWSDPGNTAWNLQGEQTIQPYFTSDIASNTGARTVSFDIAIDASTPPDVYDLEFAMAGKVGDNLFYQDEHFYLAVGMTFWAPFPVRDAGIVDTGNWLDFINVLNGDWIWSYSLADWIYMPESNYSELGGWAYFPK